MQLDGKVAIATGAAQGIGAEYARGLAQAGAVADVQGRRCRFRCPAPPYPAACLTSTRAWPSTLRTHGGLCKNP